MKAEAGTFSRRLELARSTHAWDVSPKDAIQIQAEFRSKVRQTPLGSYPLHRVAGIDVGFPRNKTVARAAIVLLEFPSLQIIEQTVAEMPVHFPYVPGLLSFREIPVILHALERLHQMPDLLITDGHGLSHPRRFGLACHLGVLLDLPTIGCAKSILIGKHAPLGTMRGSTAALVAASECIGMAVRTRDGVKPVYISVGHWMDLPLSVKIMLACGGGYRLPEPTRLAHLLASRTA